MSFTCRFHPDIERDYSDAYEWYEDKVAGLGERFIKAVRKKIEEIAEHPQAFGRRVNKGYREAQVDFFPYLIIYKVYKDKNEVFISSIHHTKKQSRRKYRK
ncbi:MAG: type II toxin-antitoxin system RelE/ParE family toxin [Chitinophagaceae bacterium]|nr:type II toxin-antitoxin system RelE/ParE family toxin [Chitinophagaceae bacterium]